MSDELTSVCRGSSGRPLLASSNRTSFLSKQVAYGRPPRCMQQASLTHPHVPGVGVAPRTSSISGGRAPPWPKSADNTSARFTLLMAYYRGHLQSTALRRRWATKWSSHSGPFGPAIPTLRPLAHASTAGTSGSMRRQKRGFRPPPCTKSP